MKYKVGDRVRIRGDLETGGTGRPYVVGDMAEFRGREAEITDINVNGNYHIDIDGGRWVWAGKMFERGGGEKIWTLTRL